MAEQLSKLSGILLLEDAVSARQKSAVLTLFNRPGANRAAAPDSGKLSPMHSGVCKTFS